MHMIFLNQLNISQQLNQIMAIKQLHVAVSGFFHLV